MSWSRAELMAIVLARALRDGDVVLTGTNASIPTAAYRTAQRMRAPRVVALNGAHGTVDPSAEVVPLSSADEELIRGRFNMRLADIVTGEMRGLFDVVFLGALQVDRRGRMNLALIGDHERPRLRGPGTLGLSISAVVPRSLMYLTRHDERTFVESVDFVSADGLRHDGGIDLVVTPLCVLGPTPERDALRLISLHPGVSFETVQSRTGFALDRDGVGETPRPAADELETLRSVDTDGALRAMSFEESEAA